MNLNFTLFQPRVNPAEIIEIFEAVLEILERREILWLWMKIESEIFQFSGPASYIQPERVLQDGVGFR